MFTGIVETTGTVRSVVEQTASIRLVLEAPVTLKALRPGDSLAVNGCCLTVVRKSAARRSDRTLIHIDLLRETWKLTNLRFVSPGSAVNLERSLRADGTLDGHFVTGHIDGTGKITTWERKGTDWLLAVRPKASVMKYVVHKGSIAVDGISLTVAKVLKTSFQIWIIPHTREVTNLTERRSGDEVNLETDILGKYVERFVRSTG